MLGNKIVIVLLVISSAVACVGAAGAIYQMYQMVLLDARARGLKHPKLWALFAVNGNNSSGLLMYLLGRRRYPLTDISDDDRHKIEYRKKAAGVGLIFLAAGAIGLVICGAMLWT